MRKNMLSHMLEQGYKDRVSGGKKAFGIEKIQCRDGLLAEIGEEIAPLEVGKRLAVVSDPYTFAAAGKKVIQALEGKYTVQNVQFSLPPHADSETVALLQKEAAGADSLVAVGSGTINDLCKYAAYKSGKPYIVIATAPSMNGYSSANAAITVAGHKKSLPAQLAKAIFMDLSVMAEAPLRLIRSGVGDSLCRSTCQADWLLSHLLLETWYDEAPFLLLQGLEEALFSEAIGLIKRDKTALSILCETLLLSGLGMVIAGGSYPASQGEHLIAHTMEMLYSDTLPESYHGEQIAVTTLTMAGLQEALLVEQPVLQEARWSEKDVIEEFGEEVGKSCFAEVQPKHITREKAAMLNSRINENWADWVARIQAVRVPEKVLEAVLRQVGAPVRPLDVGWRAADYTRAIRCSPWVRNRFTFLDLMLK